MGTDAVSRQYRMITGQDSPTDAKNTKAATEPAAPGPELEPAEELAPAIVDLTKAELQEALGDLELSTSGNKPELVERLTEAEATES